MEQRLETSDSIYEEDANINLDVVNTETLVSDIYAQNELYDQSKSIFKIEDLMNALPKEMVTETKRTVCYLPLEYLVLHQKKLSQMAIKE